MPYIQVNIKQEITGDQITKIKMGMGEAISMITGKKEAQLMLQIDDGCTMFHKGEPREKIAYIHMKAFKKASVDDNRAFTKAAVDVINNVLGVPKENIYLNITEFSCWGANGDLLT